MTDERLIYEILAAVSEIPPGRVATYGQLARLIGREKNARLVGRVLRDASLYGDYPCHRVVNHAGRLAPGWPEQAELLRDEGVPLRDNTHADMRFQWREEDELNNGAECVIPPCFYARERPFALTKAPVRSII